MTILFDRKSFFDGVRAPVFAGHMTDSQVSGMEALLAAWEKSPPSPDVRFLAYALGTTAWETARTMQPIEEYGKGAGKAYVPFYGRGYVQLTWETNYAKATTRLRALGIVTADVDLVKSPALALQPDIAAVVLFVGMIEGWFTGKTLADYFGASADWINARRIVNGTDHAAEVAAYGTAFFLALTKAAAAAPAPTPIAPTSSGPSSAPASDSPTTKPAQENAMTTTATTAPVVAENPLQVIEGFLGGVASKLNIFGSSVASGGNVVSGAIQSVSSVPSAITEIETIIADIKAGNWKNEPADIMALLETVVKVLADFQVSLPVLTTAISVLAKV